MDVKAFPCACKLCAIAISNTPLEHFSCCTGCHGKVLTSPDGVQVCASAVRRSCTRSRPEIPDFARRARLRHDYHTCWLEMLQIGL